MGNHSSCRCKRSVIDSSSIDQVVLALEGDGLESSKLIIGIDFTKSNEWTGKDSFNNRCLHAVGDTLNPYEKAIAVIGKTLAPFSEDNLIPCFGFGDATTLDQKVFSFHSDHSPCCGFEEVLACYKDILPYVQLAGPTSYTPLVDAAIDIVEKCGGQYHVSVIFTDGQVTRSVDMSDAELSQQEEKTIKSIVEASKHPLSIILVGVGDGPWEDMKKKFDEKMSARKFDNFQFVNFTEFMTGDASSPEDESHEAAFATAALMQIPLQYKAAKEASLLGRVTGNAKNITPRPPPGPPLQPSTNSEAMQDEQNHRPPRQPSNNSEAMQDKQNHVCPVCLTNRKDMAFDCGHLTCRECSSELSECPICRRGIERRLRVFI